MEKVVQFGDKEVTLKADATLLLRYKAEFGKDLFAEQAKLQEAIIKDENGNTVGTDWDKFDSTIILNMAWAMAKAHDKTIPNILDWLDGFEYFSPITIYSQIAELLSANMKVDRKND